MCSSDLDAHHVTGERLQVVIIVVCLAVGDMEHATRAIEDAPHNIPVVIPVETLSPRLKGHPPLGGGIIPGSLTLISGEPGIGKSTIIMQTANNIALSGKKVLYIRR